MLQKIILLILLFSLSYCKKYISVTMATATSVNSGLPFDLFEGKVWKADENAGFVKMHIYPDEPIILSRIELQSCEKDFEPLEVFINFDEFIRSPERKGKNASIKFASPVTARSVTFNFEKNIGVCLNSLKLFDDKDKQVYLKGPNIVEGTVKASETSSPESSYSVMNMFDSRFEDAYASKKGAK
ncbi:MAG: hypothetical protein KDK36_13460, partial [Leptospiraceae bacterium]|nr:hypothetical protein [Leptospiraceae bacterium]